MNDYKSLEMISSPYNYRNETGSHPESSIHSTLSNTY